MIQRVDQDLHAKVLVVEDEEAIRTMITYNLEDEGFEVRTADNGDDALMAVDEALPDVILLDWMLPGGMSGLEICGTLREKLSTRAIPIMMLTAKGEEADRVQGLDTGADDYMVKPFSPKELIARIRALLRRSRPAITSEALDFEGLHANLATHEVTYKGKDVKVGPTEFRLLCHFMEHPKHVYSREQLLDSVWGYDIYVEIRTVDVHIRRLRKALADVEPGLEGIIQTVRSAGYIMRALDDNS